MCQRRFGELGTDTQMYVDLPDGRLGMATVPAGKYEFVGHDVPDDRKLLGLGLSDPLRRPWTVIRGTTVGGPTEIVRDQCGGAFEYVEPEHAARVFANTVRDLRSEERLLGGLQELSERKAAQARIGELYQLAALFARDTFSINALDAMRYVQHSLLQACMAYLASAEQALARKCLRQFAFFKGADAAECEAMLDRVESDLFGDRHVLVGQAVVDACLEAGTLKGRERNRALFAPMRPKAGGDWPRWWGLVDAAEERRVYWGDDEGRVTLEGLAVFLVSHGVRVNYDAVERVARQPDALVGPTTLRVCAHVCEMSAV